MKKVQHFIYQTPRVSHYVMSVILLALVAGATMLYTSSHYREVSWAASPTFTMTQSGNSLRIVVNGTDEGLGLYGAEMSIPYDVTKVEVTSSEFNPCPFDSCLDLSEVGTLKFFAASSLPENGGNAVTQQEAFATINLNFLGTQEVLFAFFKCQIIDENK
ncbi:MAG: hypothetical protein V1908_00330, partial [Candidatus Peregrinibacteria bacterium]